MRDVKNMPIGRCLSDNKRVALNIKEGDNIINTRKSCCHGRHDMKVNELVNYIRDNIIDGRKLRIRKIETLPEDVRTEILTRTLRCSGSLSERVHWILSGLDDYPVCKTCGGSLNLDFIGVISGYRTHYCSKVCLSKNKEVREKTKLTNLERYGVENPNQSDTVRAKTKRTNLEKYGVENPAQNDDVQLRITKTMKGKYGASRVLQTQKGREQFEQTMIDTYGTHNANYNEELNQRRIDTMHHRYGVTSSLQLMDKRDAGMLGKYGVINPMHNPISVERNQKIKSKQVIICGVSMTLMGYEDVAVRELSLTFPTEHIIWKRSLIPKIVYQLGNKHKRYYPDLWLPTINTLIEVKSTWTWNKDIEQNQLKIKASIEAGYNIEVWICSNKEVLEKIKGTEVPFISF